MADIIYGRTHEVYGTNSFVELDYKGYLEKYKFLGDNAFWNDLGFAGLILTNDDNGRTLESFINMCHKCKPHLIVIEFCHLSECQAQQDWWEASKELFKSYGQYIDLASYETKLAYGLKFNNMIRK